MPIKSIAAGASHRLEFTPQYNGDARTRLHIMLPPDVNGQFRHESYAGEGVLIQGGTNGVALELPAQAYTHVQLSNTGGVTRYVGWSFFYNRD